MTPPTATNLNGITRETMFEIAVTRQIMRRYAEVVRTTGTPIGMHAPARVQ